MRNHIISTKVYTSSLLLPQWVYLCPCNRKHSSQCRENNLSETPCCHFFGLRYAYLQNCLVNWDSLHRIVITVCYRGSQQCGIGTLCIPSTLVQDSALCRTFPILFIAGFCQVQPVVVGISKYKEQSSKWVVQLGM